jgi:hypothetical protein
MKKLFFMCLIVLVFSLLGCNDAAVVSSNLSQAADQFEIYRRVVFYNGITDSYMLKVEGYCSIRVDDLDNQLELTVKTESGSYLKHYLGLSDNVTYFVEQLDTAKVSDARYRVIFKPSAIIPNIDLE